MSYNNKCIEVYRKCEDYTENVKKDICESLITDNYYDANCVYENNKCVTKYKTCSDYNTEIIKENCKFLFPGLTTKCLYSNGDCIEKKKIV